MSHRHLDRPPPPNKEACLPLAGFDSRGEGDPLMTRRDSRTTDRYTFEGAAHVGESCRLRILATCVLISSRRVYNRREAHDRFYAWEKEKDARGDAVGREEREREREAGDQKRKRRRKRKDGRDEIAKRREEYLNRDVALQVGVRRSGCRSSGELVEESTLQRWHHRSRSQLTRLRWSERTEKSPLHNYRCPRNCYYRLDPRGHDLNNGTDIGFNNAIVTAPAPGTLPPPRSTRFLFVGSALVDGEGCQVKWRKRR